jgi:aspartate/methionine/tyrosine aminotransferase
MEADMKDEAGLPYVRLDMGEPSFPPPSEVADYVAALLHKQNGQVGYSAPKGSLRLRGAIAKWRGLEHHDALETESVLITIGGAGAIFAMIQELALGAPRVWIPSVSYPVYHALGESGRLAMVGWYEPTESGIADCSMSAASGDVVILVNPLNPQGGVLHGPAIEGSLREITRKGCRLVIDNSFEDIIYAGDSSYYKGELARQRTLAALTIHSFSKSFSLPGWRVGYAIVNDPELRERIMLAGWYAFLAPPLVSQWAAECALSVDYASYIQPIRQELRKRRDMVLARLPPEMIAEKPIAGYFIFLRGAPGFASMLADKHHVISVDGRAFGCADSKHFRINIAAPAACLAAGLDAIAELERELREV